MRRLLVVVVLCAAGCVDDADPGGPWTELTSLTGPLAPEAGSPPTPRDPPGCALRIATWNVHFGADPVNLAAQILASHDVASADVLITQEIEAHPTETGSRAQRLAEALGMTWVYAPARIEGDGTHGLAIFSRYPLEDAAVRQLPFVDRPINPAHRIALAADVVIGDRRIRVVDVHLETRLSPGDRIRQLHPAVNDVGTRMIVGGDLNTQPWAWVAGTVPLTSTEAVVGQEHAQIVDDYLAENGFAGAVPPSTTTMRIPVFGMRLDNLYARDLSIVASGVEHVDGSDHWPVWFDVTWGACQP